ncbi:MAG: transporter related protein [Bacteroidetes bacterium]|nr:transporter related protein [Bacteroidota bacterium]
MNSMELLEKEITTIIKEIPYIGTLFETYGIRPQNDSVRLGQYLDTLTDEFYEDIGIDRSQLISNLVGFVALADQQPVFKVNSVTIIGGHDKSGKPEDKTITLHVGSITSIVGPTGSGKSRLLGDIEWLAQGDTPTGRSILINDAIPDTNLRFSLEHKLVAQLSQNMNFVMDASVGEFIAMHAESRMIKNVEQIVGEIIRQANLLAGEQFTNDTALTALSGGQSRALMIADTALLSTSPVVLIDEIENAGIDRKRALQLLVKNEKIILIATHDPILALMAEQRMVIKNGGIHKLITTTPQEKANLVALEELDAKMLALRNRLRSGEIIDNA